MQHGGIDRVLVFLFFLLEVAGGVAGDGRALVADGLAFVQQGVREGSLPAAAVAAEQDVTDVGGGICGGCSSSRGHVRYSSRERNVWPPLVLRRARSGRSRTRRDSV